MKSAARRSLLWVVVLTTVATSGQAQQVPPGVFRLLSGEWRGSGTLMGRDARFEMRWTSPASGYAVLTFGNGAIRATALYRLAGATIDGVWYDSRGVRLDLSGHAGDSILTVHWRGSEEGRTTYRVHTMDEAETVDSVRTATGWREFARARYQRVAPSAAAATALAPVAWLAGCWRRERGTLVTDEQWMAPSGNALLGMSRTLRNGVLVEYEHLRVAASDSGVHYIAHPSRQAETAFALTAYSDTTLVFANPAHDFPQRVGYRRVGADSLLAWIDGETSRGHRTVEFPMARVACGIAGR